MRFLENPFKEKKTVALFHVGSGLVSAALLRLEEGKKPVLLPVLKTGVNLGYNFDSSFLRREIHRALERIAESLAKKAGAGGADEAICLFSLPWHNSHSQIFEFSAKEPFEVTASFLDRFKQDGLKGIQERSREYFGAPAEHLLFIEKEISNVVLNGYRLKNPLGKKARTLSLGFYAGAAVKETAEKMEEIIKSRLKVPEVEFHSFPFVGLTVLKSVLARDDSFIMIEPGEEITETVLVRSGFIEEIVSFPKGVGFFGRRLASALNIPLSEARSLLRQEAAGHLEEGEAAEKVIKEAGGEWLSLLGDSLERMAASAVLPAKKFLLGNDFSEVLLSQMKEGKIISSSALVKKFAFPFALSDSSDVLILILALFAVLREPPLV